MTWGTLGTPTTEITDMSTLTQVGGVTFVPDPMGGQFAVTDGVNDACTGDSLFDALDTQYQTIAFLYRLPANSQFCSMIHQDQDAPAGRVYQITANTAGTMAGLFLSGVGGSLKEARTTVAQDDDVVRIFIVTYDGGTSVDKTDHTFKCYGGPVNGTMEEITTTGSTWAYVEAPTVLPDTYYLLSNQGGTPAPNGTEIGQVRCWNNQFCDLADAQAIQQEYLDQMTFGTLGEPDTEITDMSTLTQVGGVTFEDDFMGGQFAIGDGVNDHVTGSTLFDDMDTRYQTVAFLFKVPANAQTCSMVMQDRISPAGRIHQLTLAADGTSSGLFFSGVAGTGKGVYGTDVHDDDEYRIFIATQDGGTDADLTDHTFKTYVGKLNGTLEETTTTGGNWDFNGSPTTLPDTYYLISNQSSFPCPNGTRIGQVRAWNDKFTDTNDAESIRREYLDMITDFTYGQVRYYKADDNAATTNVIDSGTDGTDLTLNGGSNTEDVTTTGQVDASLILDGVADQVKGTVPTLIDEGLTQDFTTQIAVKILSTPAAQDTVYGLESGTATDCGIQIEVNPGVTGITMKAEQSGSAVGKQFPSSVVTNGVWQLLTVTWDASEGEFTTWYNGAIETDTAQTGGIAASSACMVIGSRCNDARYTNMEFDETVVWDWILSADQIADTYLKFNGGVSVNDPVPSVGGDGLLPRILPLLIPKAISRIYS